MVLTVLALVAIVLMGGVIAYNGDVVGRRFGKRRVTVFGMRPRHTAILITSVTGVAISALTAATLFMAVPQVRQVILEGEEAIRQRAHLQRETQALQAQIPILQSQREAAEAEIVRQKGALSGLRIKAARLQAQIARLGAINTSLQAQKSRLIARNDGLTSRNLQLAKSNGLLEAENRQKAQYNSKLQDENGQLARQNEDLTRQKAALTKERDVLTRSNGDLREQGNKLAEDNAALTQQNKRLTEENNELMAIVKQISPDYQSLGEAYRAVLNGHVIVHTGEELARVVVPADSSPEEVRRILDGLLDDAGETAAIKGAGPGKGSRPVRVADKRIWTQKNSQTGAVMVPIDVTAAQRTQAVVDQLTRTDEPTCVLAVAVANTVEREPAIIDYQPRPESIIFTKGDVIGTYRFAAGEPAEQVFAELVTFLKTLGRDAVSRGAIPHLDPVTGEPQVGSLSAGEIVKLVERVRAAAGPAQITALAARDINTSGALELDFQVVPIS